MKTLKEFKKEIKALGYRVKTEIFTNPFGGGGHRHLQVLDQQGHFVAGSGANIYPAEHIAKHDMVFNLLNANRGLVYDTDYNPPLKVLF